MDNTHRIIPVNGHYEVYDSNGKFVCSGDTQLECEDELIAMLVEDAKTAVELDKRERVVA